MRMTRNSKEMRMTMITKKKRNPVRSLRRRENDLCISMPFITHYSDGLIIRVREGGLALGRPLEARLLGSLLLSFGACLLFRGGQG